MTNFADPARDQFDLFAPPYQVEEVVSARARRIRIEIRSADCVRLVIPHRDSRSAALAFLASRRGWVDEKLAEYRRQAERSAVDAQPMRWDGRDHIPLRGAPHLVALTPSSLRAPMLRIEAGRIEIFASSTLLAKPDALRTLMIRHLRHEAERDARPLLDREALRLGASYRGLRLGDQRSLWGSCTADGMINLNWRLVLAPPDVLRYVVVHEVCHLIQRDHSDAFWALVAEQMPDYRPCYDWLRQHGNALHLVLAKTP